MFDYLIDHALKNVWCTPDQDLQAIFSPARLTPINGVQDKVTVLWETFSLPTQKERYHVYQIGQLHPSLLGLFPERGVWRTFANVANLEKLVVDLYAKNGVQFPRTESYVLINRDQNVLFAVKLNPRLPVDLNKETLYIRLYSNAFFDSIRNAQNKVDDYIFVGGGRVTNMNQLLLWQRDMKKYRALPGLTQTYLNGRLVQDFSPVNAVLGDVVEWVYDSTVQRVVELPVKDLPTFNSELDGKRKYLLHYPADQSNDSIDYIDDLDIYLLQYQAPGKYNGVYFHKNQADAVRMVTHKDYAIPVAYLAGYVTNSDGYWNDIKDLTVRIIIRQSGYYRPLVNEHHRIKELYKLADGDLSKALLGVDSTVPEWRAEQLEASAYAQIMRSSGLAVNRLMVQNAYGYNAISKLVADVPLVTVASSGKRLVDLPYGLRVNSTMYEFDNQGRLLGFYYHQVGDQYTVANTNCALVEGIIGKGGLEQDTVFGQTQVPINPENNYRMYLCDVKKNKATEKWVDVTGKADYAIANGKVVWVIDAAKKYPLVKGDTRFLAYVYKVTPLDGLLRFSVNAKETHNGLTTQRVLSLPVGKLDLWLNGYKLIEGLDYFVKWPEIVVCNKRYWIADAEQQVTVRGTGFCTPDFVRELPDEVGFVQYGQLSRNSRFNVRDDKVMHMVAGGRLMQRQNLQFSEDATYVVNHGTLPNGTPYAIDDIVVPLRGLTNEDTYSLRAKSQVVDREIEDYLTLKHPEPTTSLPNIIPARYEVYSPFTAKIFHDLKRGVLWDDRLKGHYPDALVLEMVKGYEDLLQFDPAFLTTVDDRYVSVHPHELSTVQTLNVYQYTFLLRAVKLYFKERVDISQFVKIGDL